MPHKDHEQRNEYIKGWMREHRRKKKEAKTKEAKTDKDIGEINDRQVYPIDINPMRLKSGKINNEPVYPTINNSNKINNEPVYPTISNSNKINNEPVYLADIPDQAMLYIKFYNYVNVLEHFYIVWIQGGIEAYVSFEEYDDRRGGKVVAYIPLRKKMLSASITKFLRRQYSDDNDETDERIDVELFYLENIPD